MITVSRLLSISFLLIGLVCLGMILSPIISFKVFEITQKYANAVLISPKTTKNMGVLGVSIKANDDFSYFISNTTRAIKPSYSSFTVSIPKIKVDHAKVLVDSNDFSRTLAHLPGSGLPGEKGNVFVSGHSALSPILSIQNAVFANLMDIKKGDEITVEAGGTKFNYKVVDLKIVNPTDISVINPPDDQGRYISLMTCVPPGLNYKRLIVIGKIL